MTDAELAALSQQGNTDAFNDLAQRWYGSLFRFARRLLGNEEDARDACQDALLKAYQNIGRLRDPSKFKAWAHHIVLNLCRDRHRAQKAHPAQSFEENSVTAQQVLATATPEAAPDRRAEQTSIAELVGQVLEVLSLEQRTAVLLREYQGFTSEEIAQITGVPAATVRTRIFYGLKSMRRVLNQRGITDASLLNGDAGR